MRGMMQTDYHSHILPEMDDGARSEAVSIELMRDLWAQGIRTVYATPHYYMHREPMDKFLLRREAAYGRIRTASEQIGLRVRLGAEVHVERGLCNISGIGRLCYEGTSRILFEFPYAGFQSWMLEEIENIVYLSHISPVIAHFERYLEFYDDAAIQSVLALPKAVIQINVQSLKNWRVRSWVKGLLKQGNPVILGTDCHNLENRRPEIKGIAIDKRISERSL